MITNINLSFSIAALILAFQISLLGQGNRQYTSSFEIEGAIGSINSNSIIPLYAFGAPYSNPEGFYDFLREDTQIGSFGYSMQLGLLANRNLGNSFFKFRSGIQFHYMKSKVDSRREQIFFLPLEGLVEGFDQQTIAAIRGAQIPVLLEYRKPFDNWTAYAHLGFSLGYYSIKYNQKSDGRTHYDYTIEYNDDCSCNEVQILNQYSPPREIVIEMDKKENNHELNRIFGVGAIFQSKRGKTLRLGYRFSKGTFVKRNVRDIHTHQLEFSTLWPEKEHQFPKNEKNKARWAGWFVGTSLSYGRNLHKTEIGVGKNINLMYISRFGLGGRLTATNYYVNNYREYYKQERWYKAEILYQIPLGIQFHFGITHGDVLYQDYDKTRGIQLGTGGIIPLYSFLGIRFHITGHYFYKSYKSRYILETGLGLAIRIFK